MTGLFGSEKPLEIQTFFSKKDSFGLSSFIPSHDPDHDGLTDTGKKSSSQDAPNKDEDEAYHYDIQKEKTIWVSDYFKGIMSLAILLVVIFYSQLVDLDRPGAGDMAFIFGDFTILYLFLVCPIFLSDIFFRKTFPSDLWKQIPQKMPMPRMREFMMSMMDGSKQISYRKTMKLSLS